MVPRITRGIVSNCDVKYYIDFDHILNSSGSTLYTFDSQYVYDFRGEPVFRVGKDSVDDYITGETIYTFEGNLVMDTDHHVRYRMVPSDFPNICAIFGRGFVCNPDGSLAYVLVEGYVLDPDGNKVYSVEGTRYTLISDPSCFYEIDGNTIRDRDWNIVNLLNGFEVRRPDGSLLFMIQD